MKKSMRLTIVSLAMLSLLPMVGVANQVTYDIVAGEYRITEDKDGFHTIHMLTPGYGVLGSPGNPTLPEKILRLRVPEGTDPSSVKMTLEVVESEVLIGFNMIPNPPLRPVSFSAELPYDPDYEDWGPEKSIVDGKNMYVYGKDAKFPAQPVEYLGLTTRKEPSPGPILTPRAQAVMPGTPFENFYYLDFAFRPFLYNPVSRELTLTKRATLIITYEVYTPIKSGQVTAGDTYDYVIITTNNVVSNSERLANFVHLKELQGHKVKVVTETDFQGLTGQAPNGRAEKIRQWLKDNYVALGIDYVLLIGDPHPDHADIPMKMCWPNYFSWTYRESPTDYFYADLTGNWDLDNDQYFGEGLEATHAKSPDPSVGEDTFSVRWTGKVMCDFDETYTFHTFSDDGLRLYIDGTLVIDNWTEHLPANDYWTHAMTAGKHDITLEFRENYGDGIVQLFWSTGVPRGDPHFVDHDIIPETHLYDDSDTAGGLTGRYYDNNDFTDLKVTRKDNVVNFIWGTGDKGVGGIDGGAEVFVGRIPVYDNAYAQLDKILGKIIQYQTDPGDISWRESILLPMKPLWDDTPAYHLGEGIRNDIAGPAGFASYRIYDDDYASVGGPTPELWPTTENNVKYEWKKGYGMVVWATHGSQTGASSIFNSSLTHELDDTLPSFTFQASCLNGYPENNNNLGYALLKEGAIATVSASRVSWDSGGAWTFDPNDGSNHNLAYFYAKRIIDDGTPKSAGAALYLTKGDIPSVGMNETDYNLYGDPDCYLLTTLPNLPPVANANGPYLGNEGSVVAFNAGASYDPEGDSLQYRWDFNDDGVWDTGWSSSPTASRTWCDNVTGTVRVEVRDQLGFTHQATASVTVQNVAPTANAGPDQTANEGTPVLFNGTFTDPGCDTWAYEWNFGDSSVASGTLSPTHAYGDNGSYTVTLKVTDDDGGAGTDTMVVTVNNVAPAVTIDSLAPSHPIPGQLVKLEGSFTDPGWQDTHSAHVDWGDGKSEDPPLSDLTNAPPAATGKIKANHTFCTAGNFSIGLTVTDDDGGVGANTLPVTVDISPDMPGMLKTDDMIRFLSFTRTLPGTLGSATFQWRNGYGVADQYWIYQNLTKDWLFFFVKGRVPKYDPSRPVGTWYGNFIAITVPRVKFEEWFWCGMPLYDDHHHFIGYGCHPEWGPGPPDIFAPWVQQRIDQSLPYIVDLLSKAFGGSCP